jgi:hypothetical protein
MKQKLLYGALVIAVAVLLLRLFGPSAKGQIRSQLEELAQDASAIAGRQPLERIALIKKHSQRLADNLSFHLTSGHEQKALSFNRKDFEQKAMGAQSAIESLDVKIEGISVDIDSGKATAHFQIQFVGSLKGNQGQFYDHWSAIVEFNEKEGAWLLAHITAENLRPDPKMP